MPNDSMADYFYSLQSLIYPGTEWPQHTGPWGNAVLELANEENQ